MKKQVVYKMCCISFIVVLNMIVATKSAKVDMISELTILKEQFLEREIFYEKKLAEMDTRLRAEIETRLHNAEEKSKAVEYKLAEAENRFNEAEERRISVEKFFEKKIAELENKLFENERGYKANEMNNNKKFPEDIDTFSIDGVKLHDSEIATKLEFGSGMEPKMKPSKDNRTDPNATDLLTTGRVPHKMPIFHRKVEGKDRACALSQIEYGFMVRPYPHQVYFKKSTTVPTVKSGSHNTNIYISQWINASNSGNSKTWYTLTCIGLQERRQLASPESHRVAFSSYLSHEASGLGTEHTIPFDQVLLNAGQSFDTVLHAFICPVNGIYMFQSSLLSTDGGHIETEIVKDGSVLVRMYAAGVNEQTYGYDQGSNSAIIQCNKGEHVWVRVRAHNGNAVYAERFSTFSGFLLWEI